MEMGRPMPNPHCTFLREDLFACYAKLGFTVGEVLPFPGPERMLRPLHLVQISKSLIAPENATA